jgi:hypothetical protein
MMGLTEAQVKTFIIQMVIDTKKRLLTDKIIDYDDAKHRIIKYLKIDVSEMNLDKDDGLYSPSPTPSIAVDPSMSKERMLFTLFHELTHHLIRNHEEIYSFIHEHTSNDEEAFHATLEKYCNIGAAEFIIPAANVVQSIMRKGFVISLLKDLDDQHPASKPAIAAQLAACAHHKCFVLICEYGFPPEFNLDTPLLDSAYANYQQQLYVQYAFPSPQVVYRIRRYTVLSKDHLFYEVYKNKSKVSDSALMPFRNSKHPTPCEAFFYKGKVYGVFNMSSPSTPISEHQLGMDV